MFPSVTAPRRWLVLALSLLLFLAIIALVMLFPEEWLPVRQWGLALESAGWPGVVLFVLVSTAATAIGLPRQLVAFTGGLAYGLYPGLLLSWVAALSGCHTTVQLSRHVLRSRIEQKYPAFIEKLEALLQHDTFLKVLILRFQPLGTNLLTNLCVGLTKIPYRQFLLASGVGYVPQMMVFALLGAGVRVGEATQSLISGLLVLVSMVLATTVFVHHRQRKNRVADKTID